MIRVMMRHDMTKKDNDKDNYKHKDNDRDKYKHNDNDKDKYI